MDYADESLITISEYDSNDINVMPFADPYLLRNYVVMNRWSDGMLYCKDIYDVNFTIYDSFCTSDDESYSPTWYEPIDNVTYVDNETSKGSLINRNMPDHDTFFVTTHAHTKSGFESITWTDVRVNITIYNSTNSTFQSLLLDQNVNADGDSGAGNFTVLFEPVTGIFRNKTGLNINITATWEHPLFHSDFWIGFPKNIKWVYVTNALRLPLTVGAEVGFYIVPYEFWDSVKAGTSGTVKYLLYYQDVEEVCVCDPWGGDTCVNATHKRQIRDCTPVGCADGVRFILEPQCGITEPEFQTGDLPADSIFNSSYYIEQANITDTGTVTALTMIEFFTLPVMIATYILIMVSVFAGGYVAKKTEGSGAITSIVIAILLIMMYSIVGIYPAWAGIVLIIISGVAVAYFGGKWFSGG